MTFQTIFNIQQSMTVNTRRMVGQQTSRSGQITVAQYLTTVPWVFTVDPHGYLYYPDARAIIQAIDNLDRQGTETIQFAASNANLSWFTKYLGAMTTPAGTLASTPAANTQTLSIAVATGSGYAFVGGDFIMVGGYTYKVTASVTRATSPVAVGIHRPLIGSPVSGAAVAVGNNCTFTVIAESCPTYTLTPMAAGAFVKWDSPFVFREYIA